MTPKYDAVTFVSCGGRFSPGGQGVVLAELQTTRNVRATVIGRLNVCLARATPCVVGLTTAP